MSLNERNDRENTADLIVRILLEKHSAVGALGRKWGVPLTILALHGPLPPLSSSKLLSATCVS